MSGGRTWHRRSLGRGDHELIVTDAAGRQQVAALVSLQAGVHLPTLLVEKITALVAEHHGEIVDDPRTRRGAA